MSSRLVLRQLLDLFQYRIEPLPFLPRYVEVLCILLEKLEHEGDFFDQALHEATVFMISRIGIPEDTIPQEIGHVAALLFCLAQEDVSFVTILKAERDGECRGG